MQAYRVGVGAPQDSGEQHKGSVAWPEVPAVHGAAMGLGEET